MIPSGALKILKPIGAGLALAFLVTGLVDGPAPVNFRPEDPYSAKQAEIVEPQAAVVIEKNIMKLGSLLSVPEGQLVLPQTATETAPGEFGPSVKGEVLTPGS